jgi:hypothetical protein
MRVDIACEHCTTVLARQWPVCVCHGCVHQANTWKRFRQSVANLPLPRPGVHPRPVHVRFVVDEVALGQVFLPVLVFSSMSSIPPVLHTHSVVCPRRCVMLPVPVHKCRLSQLGSTQPAACLLRRIHHSAVETELLYRTGCCSSVSDVTILGLSRSAHRSTYSQMKRQVYQIPEENNERICYCSSSARRPKGALQGSDGCESVRVRAMDVSVLVISGFLVITPCSVLHNFCEQSGLLFASSAVSGRS